MFETSKDILNLALAIGSFLALFSLAVVFFYIAIIIRNIVLMMRQVKNKVEATEKIITGIAQKFSGASAMGKLAVDIAKIYGDVVDVKKNSKKRSRKATSETKK